MASKLRKEWQLAKARADQAYKRANAPFLLKVPPVPLPFPKFNKGLGPALDKLEKAEASGKDAAKLQQNVLKIVRGYLKEVREPECNNTAGTDKIMKNLKKALEDIEASLA